MGDGAQSGKTIGCFIERQALKGRNKHAAHLQHEEDAEEGKYTFEFWLSTFCELAQQVKQPQADQRDRNQFEKAASGIFSIGETFY